MPWSISRMRRRAPEGRRSSPPRPGGGSIARASDAGGPAAAASWHHAWAVNGQCKGSGIGEMEAAAEALAQPPFGLQAAR